MEAAWEKADSTRQSANGTIGECLGELFMNAVYEMMLLSYGQRNEVTVRYKITLTKER